MSQMRLPFPIAWPTKVARRVALSAALLASACSYSVDDFHDNGGKGDAGLDASDAGDAVRVDSATDSLPPQDSGADTAPPTCTSGLTLCGSECVDLAKDINHCGDCTTRCDPTMERCKKGSCQ